MATAGAHGSVLMLTSYLSNINYNLMMVSAKRQAVVAQQSEIMAEYSRNQSNQMAEATSAAQAAVQAALGSSSTADITVALEALDDISTMTSNSSWTNDPNFMTLHLQEVNLDNQQKKLETSAKSVTANLEAQQKLLDNNIKEDFAPALIP